MDNLMIEEGYEALVSYVKHFAECPFERTGVISKLELYDEYSRAMAGLFERIDADVSEEDYCEGCNAFDNMKPPLLDAMRAVVAFLKVIAAKGVWEPFDVEEILMGVLDQARERYETLRSA